jgi:Skp family chaperone for outer membrane proteins
MSNPELKIANFERMVIGEAQQRRDKSLEDISREKEKALAKIKKELNEEAQRKYKSETKKLTKAKNERVFQKQLECKREILKNGKGLSICSLRAY